MYNAFVAAKVLAAKTEMLNKDRIVFLGHSLGNVVVSSAIKDHLCAPDQYYMLNAAVPMQAYDGVSDHKMMYDKDWNGIQREYMSPYWHGLFSTNDFRGELFWTNRFGVISCAVNCHSSTDEVICNYDDDERFQSCWIEQEKLKGRAVIHMANILPSTDMCCEAGWGFNNGWNVSNKANQLTREDVITQPLFTPFRREAEKMHSLVEFTKDDSDDQYRLRAKFLGDAIPATSYAAGANKIDALNGDIDYMEKCISKDWPRKNSQWRHSDIKNVAFFYTYKIFEIIRDGRMK